MKANILSAIGLLAFGTPQGASAQIGFPATRVSFETIKGQLAPDTVRVSLSASSKAQKARLRMVYQPATDWLSITQAGKKLAADSMVDIALPLELVPKGTAFDAGIYDASIELTSPGSTEVATLDVRYTVTTNDALGDWAAAHNIAIRKTFDGSKDEQNPASFLWINNGSSGGGVSSAIDVAVKISEIAYDNQLVIYPVGEYHRSTDGKKPANSASGSGKAEWRPLRPSPLGGSWTIVPTFNFETKLARDYVANSTDFKVSAQVQPTSVRPWLPGATNRVGTRYVGRYYPYLGVEHYSFAGKGSDTTFTSSVARLWAEAYPLGSGPYRYLQLTVDWSARKKLNGATIANADVLHDFSTGATLYVDGKQHAGIGIDYARGNDASKHFAFRERTTIGLKLKL